MTELPLNELEVGDLVRRLHRRDITAVALAEACLAASARVGDTINAHVALDEGKVLAEARALDGMREGGAVAGPLHGIPVAVKDNFWDPGLSDNGMLPGSRGCSRRYRCDGCGALAGRRRHHLRQDQHA